MKKKQSFASALLLMLVVAGCRQATDPSFSPDGQTLVFEKSGVLFLRSAHGDRKISDSVNGQVVWSETGNNLAFAADGGATILNIETQKSVRAKDVTPPFAWQGDLLAGLGARKGDGSQLVMVDARSGSPTLRVDLPLAPSAMAPIGQGEMLMWDQKGKTYRFDGLSPVALPSLDGMTIIGSRPRAPRWLLEKSFAKPHTHRQLVRLYEWDGGDSEAPQPIATLDLTAVLGDPSKFVFMQRLKAAGDWNRLAAVVLSMEFRKADRDRLFQIIDRYDFLNAMVAGKNPKMSKSDQAFLKRMENSGVMSEICLTGMRNGPWSVVQKETVPLGKYPMELRVGLSADGSKIAVSGDKETKVYPLVNPRK